MKSRRRWTLRIRIVVDCTTSIVNLWAQYTEYMDDSFDASTPSLEAMRIIPSDAATCE